MPSRESFKPGDAVTHQNNPEYGEGIVKGHDEWGYVRVEWPDYSPRGTMTHNGKYLSHVLADWEKELLGVGVNPPEVQPSPMTNGRNTADQEVQNFINDQIVSTTNRLAELRTEKQSILDEIEFTGARLRQLQHRRRQVQQ